MIKAILIVASLNGGGDYVAKMPDMQTCLDVRMLITEQDSTLKTLCIPREDDTVNLKTLFNEFTSMVREMKEIETDHEDINK
jgi:hypothetical protein|tara:strand:+ start:76 stop:321 length:246 start_codon:yes stop_codon:yes gene_type:complete